MAAHTWAKASIKCHVKDCYRLTQRRQNRKPVCIIHMEPKMTGEEWWKGKTPGGIIDTKGARHVS